MDTKRRENHREDLGLVLSGGGARGAYQAGVLKSLVELAEREKLDFFPVLVGTSAGSINASFMAAFAKDPIQGVKRVTDLWSNLSSEQVFRTDAFSLGRIGIRWLKELSSGPVYKHKRALSLLNTEPLRQLLESHISFAQIQENLQDGVLRGLAVSATEYQSSDRITFVQAQEGTPPWRRLRRRSEIADITSDHIMASSAIPMFFPPVKVGSRFFGDGCLRNSTPISPAIKLGGRRLVVVGVQGDDLEDGPVRPHTPPSLATILSVIINAIFMDGMDADVERLTRINGTLKLLSEEQRVTTNLHHIDMVYIRPSQDIAQVALEESEALPRTVRFLLEGLGSEDEASEIISYLLFESSYCRRLVEMGYQDAQARQEELLQLWHPGA